MAFFSIVEGLFPNKAWTRQPSFLVLVPDAQANSEVLSCDNFDSSCVSRVSCLNQFF